MAKNFTVADALKDQIDQQAYDKPAAQADKRPFRTKTGTYKGLLSRVERKEVAQGANEGRPYVTVMVKLYEGDKFRGNAWIDMSWKLPASGKKDQQFNLFSALLRVLGAPITVQLKDVLAAIEGEEVSITGSEYFNVPFEDILDAKLKAERANAGYAKVYHFVTDDATAMAYQDMGHKSRFMVNQIVAIDDDIPF